MCHELNPGYQRAQWCTDPRQTSDAGYHRDGFCRAHRADMNPWCRNMQGMKWEESVSAQIASMCIPIDMKAHEPAVSAYDPTSARCARPKGDCSQRF